MTENPLGYEKIPKLLKNFAVPSIVYRHLSPAAGRGRYRFRQH